MIPKKQHYVPQLLLRNFCKKKDRLFVYDKFSGKSFAASIKDTGCQSGFYDFNLESLKYTAELGLSKVESIIASSIHKLINERNVYALSLEDRQLVATFVCLQLLRVPSFRDSICQIDKAIFNKIEKISGSRKVQNLTELKEDDINSLSCLMIPELILELFPFIYSKSWLLMETRGDRFYISDNPIILQNQLRCGPYGNLGLGVLGIEVYLPLSHELVLAMLCPSHIDHLYNYGSNIDALQHIFHTKEFHDKLSHVKRMRDHFEGGTPIILSKPNVDYLNSSQVAHSTRFVYSINQEFQLAEKMLKENPKLRKGTALIQTN